MYDSLGDRMKGYEEVPKSRLVPKMPVLMRLDGKAFHTYTRVVGCERPYDIWFNECMHATTKYLCERIQGVQLAYVQSDEISLLLTDYQSIKTQAWFDYEVQKMASVAASMCAVKFYAVGGHTDEDKLLPAFDCRVWNLPKEEVTNYFIWRQQDATRNSIQLLGQSHFSQKQLHGKSCNEIQDMLMLQKEVNWNDCPTPQKRGVCVIKDGYLIKQSPWAVEPTVQRSKWVIDEEIPIFTQNRLYVEQRI
jgi:tRNA(His) guanylyltransferase